MKKTLICVNLALVLMFFQNCQKASFSTASAESRSKVLGQIGELEDSEGGSIIQDGSEEQLADDDNSGPYNVCILDGPGKSVKLGATEAGVPRGQNKIPGVVCMSPYACRSIVSKRFKVKGPEFRGYCKVNGNPHVFHATDAQIQEKINKL